MNGVHLNFTTKFTFPKITAKSDSYDDDIIPNRILDQIHPVNLKEIVYDLSSFHTLHTESENIDYVASWLTEKLQNICGRDDVYIHNFVHKPIKEEDNDGDDSQQNQSREGVPSYRLKNIVCENLGSTNNTIIISAYYDSRMEDINNSTSRAPGADDNASGVSALFEVARILSNVSLNNSIIFVLFPGEEQGKWGSTQYADYIDKADVDLDLLINLDMVGFSPEETNELLIEYDSGNIVQDNDKYSQAVANYIKDIAEKYTNLNVTLGLVGNSDYLPFEALDT